VEEDKSVRLSSRAQGTTCCPCRRRLMEEPRMKGKSACKGQATNGRLREKRANACNPIHISFGPESNVPSNMFIKYAMDESQSAPYIAWVIRLA